MKAVRHMRLGARRGEAGWRPFAGLLLTATLSLASSACIAEAQSADAQDSTDEHSSADSRDIKGENPGITTLGLSGPSGDKTSPPVIPNVAPVPSPWQPDPTPGDPASNEGNGDGNGVDPGTVDSPVPSPWMTPPGSGQTETTSASEHAAPLPKTHTD